jgi:hypothetical protein
VGAVVKLQKAISLVVEDQRRGYPEMTEREAVEHARNTIGLDEIYGRDESARAYRIVLSATGLPGGAL